MSYSPEQVSALSETICQRLANGESMRRICDDPVMPDRKTVDNWREADPEFSAKCAHAREEQAEYHHDRMDGLEDRVLTGDLEPHAANVVLSNIRWRMEKLKPKVYGNKLALEHTGRVRTAREMTDAELESIARSEPALIGSDNASNGSAGADTAPSGPYIVRDLL